VGRLVTCFSRAFDRVSMHGVRRRLVEDQAAAFGLPVEFVIIPPADDPACPITNSPPGTTFPPNDIYSAAMLVAFGRLKAEGVEVVVFGDIFLEDLRAYREQLLAHAGLTGAYPLWGRDTGGLYDDFVAGGFRAVTVCVDTTRLTVAHLGRELDAAFRGSLPAGADPCVERGEYHSFAFAGPPFARPVGFTPGGVYRQPPFAFLELLPADPPP
jgi:diphthamide synthase (EF-2-diphthine--ammonia ligase)